MPLKKIVIIGAGISGLSIAWGLCNKKDFELTILEAGLDIGGLSRTIEHNGLLFDIGPHRFSPQLPKAVRFVRGLLLEGLLKKQNTHGVYFNGILYNYPPGFKDFLHGSSLRNTFIFGLDWAYARFLSSINRILGPKKDESFKDILYRQFGKSFCDYVIFPMISKVWGTKDLSSQFANIRFLQPTLTRIISRVFFRNIHANDNIFYYPRNGYGEISERIGEYLRKNKNILLELSANIESIEAKSLNGPFKVLYTQGSAKKTVEADILVSTISNKKLFGYLRKTNLVNPLAGHIDKFVSRTLRLGIFAIKDFHLTDRVIIFPEAKFIFNRISEMNLFSNLNYPEGQAILMVDVICDEGSAYDVMEEGEFNKLLLDSVLGLGWFKKANVCQNFSMRFPNAYPILNQSRYDAQEEVNKYFAGSSVILCGREASSDYNNAHNAIIKGFITARYILGEINFKEYKVSSNIIGRLPIQD